MPINMPNASTFDAPIPGQSLTDEPGKAAWENPPEYTSADKALEFLYTTMTDRANLKQFYVMISNKVPIESIARVMLFQGFGQGKWTVDMMVVLAKPLAKMLVAIAKAADIEFVLPMPYHEKRQDLKSIMKNMLPQIGAMKSDADIGATPPAPQMGRGMMSPPATMGV